MKPEVLLRSGEFYGAVLRTRHLDGLTLTETAYPPHCRVPRHAHTNAYFCLVLAGSYAEQVDGALEWTCRPASVTFHPASAPHADRFERTGGRCFNVELSEAWARRAADAAVPLDTPLHLPLGPTSTLAARLHREARHPNDLSPLVAEGLALALVGELGRRRRSTAPRRHPPPWIDRCLDLLQARFDERLSLDEVATTVGVHPAHLARAFLTHQGCTVGEYVRRLRVEHARRALEDTDASLVEIALATGFADQSHLGRTFKALVGTTPGRYRRAARGR
ncbi:MAG TPA: AraC family transcriptional regulator [Rubricoccaceae bacterium]|nr:AraC family transcriptional regulator [Rubricoccaceae bacterium]